MLHCERIGLQKTLHGKHNAAQFIKAMQVEMTALSGWSLSNLHGMRYITGSQMPASAPQIK